jgi:hypothetical protein
VGAHTLLTEILSLNDEYINFTLLKNSILECGKARILRQVHLLVISLVFIVSSGVDESTSWEPPVQKQIPSPNKVNPKRLIGQLLETYVSLSN